MKYECNDCLFLGEVDEFKETTQGYLRCLQCGGVDVALFAEFEEDDDLDDELDDFDTDDEEDLDE